MKGGRRRLFRLDRVGRNLEEGLRDEVDFHLETRVGQLMAAGRTPEEARAEALRQFGDPAVVVERCRRIDRRGARRRALMELLSDTVRDVRHAGRALAGSRGYTTVMVLSLAVGIGVNAAVFAGVRAIWFAPVPGVTGQDRIVDMVTIADGAEEWAWTFPDFAALRDAGAPPFEAVAAWSERDATLGSEGGGERVQVAYVTSDYFRVLGARPVRGRGFLESEDEGPGQHAVVVVSHEFWQERLGGRPDVPGATVTLNRIPHFVVGVAPEGFRGARVTLGSIDVWAPLVQDPRAGGDDSFMRDRASFSVQVLGRLRPGASLAEAGAAARTVFSRLAAEHAETNEHRTVRVAEFLRFPAQNRNLDLAGLAGLWGLLVVLLLIICGNLAGMALARSAAREQELGVRLALGSSRTRLVRHLMTEAALVAVMGGAAGVFLATAGMARVSPTDLGIAAPGVRFVPGPWVLGLFVALTLVTALAVGLLPALRFSRPALVSVLKNDVRGGTRAGRMQRIAASAQAGAAQLLLVVGILSFRSVAGLADRDLGFQPVGTLVTDFRTRDISSGLLDLSDEGYPGPEEGGMALIGRLIETLGSVPGVTSVAVADGVPLDLSRRFGSASRVDRPDETEARVTAELTRATEGYFTALGAPLIEGRGFRRTDDAGSEPVAVITRSLADRLWPGEDPLGRQFLWPAGREDAVPRTVVGLVGRIASSSASDDWPHVFLPLRQDYSPRILIVVRATTDPALLAGSLREAFRSVDPGLPVPRIVRAETLVELSTRQQQATGRLGGGLGLLVLLLSAMGVHGVMAVMVTGRTREIGVRMALGATRREVVRGVLGDALRLAAPGLIVGSLMAAACAAAMRSALLGMSPADPVSYLSAAGVLLLVVLLAALVPARRASSIEPVDALRTG